MGLILAIDVGTTNIKAALVDENARLLGEAISINTPIERNTAGKAEHNPEKLTSALLEICKQAIANLGNEIDGLSVTTYHFGLILTDKNNLPLTSISTFLDTTAQQHHPRFLEAIGDVDDFYSRTGCPPIFQYPVNRLHLLSVTNPAIVKKTAHVLDSKSFIIHALTDQFITDYSTANSMGCLTTGGSWDIETIKVTGFDIAQLPQVKNGFTEKIPLKQKLCSELGLKDGTTVSLGLFDGAALAAALTGFQPEIAVGNFGTSGMFRVPASRPAHDLNDGVIQSCLLQPDLFFVGAGINNCTVATNWLLSILGQDLNYLRQNQLSTPGSNGVMTFPYFTGERDIKIGNMGTGIVLGLGLSNTREDISRSFLEGVAFSYLFIKQKLDPEYHVQELRLGGGGAGNLPWMQIIADVLNLPIRLTTHPEMGIIGAACLARHGISDALRECSQRIMRDSMVVEPCSANVARYREISEQYFSIRSSLREPLLARQANNHI